MPSLGGGSGPGPASPIQQLPLSAIQQSMRGPSTAGSEYAPGSAGGGSQIHGGYGQPGPGPSTIASSATSPKFHAPPPPPALSGRHQPRPSQPSSSTAPQMAGYPNSTVTVERGLTLSLPLRSRSGKDEDEETDSPFAPPNNPSGAPSAFKAPSQQLQQPARQGTTDSDIVLGGDAADLKRTTTLPPTLKMDDLPTWSFGLGELGMESPTKTQAKSELDQGTDAPTSASKSLPNDPSKDEVKKSVTPLSAVPRGLQEGTNSASQTPLTQTPTTYLDNQSSAGDSSRQQSIATSPDTPVIHHHVVDDPTTRGQGNSGRFAMFPDKRKPTLDSFPVHLGSMISSGAPEEDSPRSQHQHDQQPKSILVDPTQQSRSGTQTSSTGHYDGASGTSSKIHFAPRPPSPITPSPVTGDSTSEEASAKERTDKDDRRLSAITPNFL
ncbi:hypothetical protein FRC14_004697 [Serendipita sp. 396]|nr:hypothetical protein FRC14_004697 [Serendipita sp. 396]